jgi:hypothetical protein
MQQMVNKDALIVCELNIDQLKTGFFRWTNDTEGKIFLAWPYGEYTVYFPVLENKHICNKGNAEFHGTMIKIINPKSLDITEITFETEPARTQVSP